jgi:outer membrane usher protein
MTAGGRFERGPHLLAGESSLAFGVPFGELGLEFRKTSAPEGQGHAAGLSYNYRHPWMNAGLEARWSSPLAGQLTEELNRVRSQVLGWIGFSAPRLISGALHVSSVVTDDGKERQALTPSLSVVLFRRVNLTTSVSRVVSKHTSGVEALTGLTVPFGGRSSFTTSSYSGLGHTSGSLAVQRSIGPGPDWGYRLDAIDNGLSSATLSGQSRVGRMQVRAEQWGGRMRNSVQVAGAVVAAGGRLHLTSPVDDAFAIVRLEGLGGIRTFLNNQFVGRTNRRGELVVAGLTSYSGNAISVAREDVPADVDLARDAVLIAPSFRGGALVTLPAKRNAPVTGRFVIALEPLLVPAYGLARITTAQSTITSPLDEHGSFYFDSLAPGAYVAIVEYFGRAYSCRVTVPTAAFAVNLGVVRCEGRAQEAGS